jgi:hypothetical protein
VRTVPGSLAALKDDGKTNKSNSKNRERQEEEKQIPFGDDTQISDREREMQRSLYCAADDEPSAASVGRTYFDLLFDLL